jgi:5'-3' exonuclease
MKSYYLNKYSSNLDIENTNLINDFIFICYFLGNDFIPHIPSLDIHQNGIEYLIINYIETIYELNQENKIQSLLKNTFKINNLFLEKFIEKLSLNEELNLKNNIIKKHIYDNKSSNNYEREMFKIENLQFKINDPIKLGSDNFSDWRIRYYKHYWNITESELEEFSEKLVKHYFYGLKWITLYYFDKCPSWDWYYPFDYPPFISDIYKYLNSTKFNKIKFKLGEPVKPTIQLLLVLPPQYHYLLPEKYQKISENNKLSYLYPINFEQDFINKKKYWMAIPILPQLNINLIKNIYLNYEKTK